MKKIVLVFVISWLVSLPNFAYESISLAGEWQFGYQRDNTNEVVKLPGSMLENGKGEDISVSTQWVGSLYDSSYYYNPYMAKYRLTGKDMKLPFFLTPEKHYVGKAWYKRVVDIPDGWRKKRVFLYLERTHIVTSLFVNGKEVGSRNSLCAAHRYDITDYVKSGHNELLLCIDNDPKRVGVGQDSHSVTDQTQGCWNGIVGRMELQARPQIYIEHIDVYPNIKDMTARVKVSVNGKAKKMRAKIEGANISIDMKANDTVFTIPMKDAVLWNEFTPETYRLTVSLGNGDEKSTTFGMREIEVRGKSFYVNGEKVQMRGTVENCCFPLTGYAPMDKESWLQVFRKCKSYGLNHMRFHSYCPPEAAFEAADEMGFYLQPEGPSWPNHGVSLGRGEYIDKYLMDETKRITADYGNHPSFAMLACGNEPRGRWVEWCSDFVDYWKAADSRRVYTGASVGGGWQWQPKSQYHVKAGARGLAWDRRQPSSDDDYTQSITSFYDKATKRTFEINEPFIAHEMGQWCAFPDFNEIGQYTGVYKAKNFEIFRDLLRDNGMGEMDRKFLMSSGRLQKLCYKYEIERQMRTPDYAGFQLLALNDYSGQGTALEGVLNVFFREKGYCTDSEFREFCSPTVILARFPKFTFDNSETLSLPVEMTNYTGRDIRDAVITYCVKDDADKVFVEGVLSRKDIPTGGNTQMGNLNISLKEATSPRKYTLELAVGNTKNHYDFWVYDKDPEVIQADDIYITDTLDGKAIEILGKGGKVLLTAAGKVRYGKNVKQQYLPVFWNTSWFKMRPPHTTGAYICKEHPVFKDFPTDDWTNLNWWELMNKQQVMQLTEFPEDFQPIVQSIDTWFVSRKIGMLFEANVLNGKLMMTSIDISGNLDKRIVARQLRKSILKYMGSEDFEPRHTIDIQLIRNLYEKDAPILDMYTKDSPDELKPKIQ